MIVFDLKCAGQGHVFEAWFGSSQAYEDQRKAGLVQCPFCGDTDVTKAVMAPAVPAKSNQRDAPSVPVSNGAVPDPAAVRAFVERVAAAQAEALKDSEWVGRNFAETARAMHYGEKDHRTIHGEVAPDEAKALVDEGVNVAPLPFPVVPPKAQN